MPKRRRKRYEEWPKGKNEAPLYWYKHFEETFLPLVIKHLMCNLTRRSIN